MQKFYKIIRQSITLSSRQPTWWLFALLQAMIFSSIGQLARPERLRGSVVFLLIVATLLLAPLTIWLWQNIVAAKNLTEVKLNRQFVNQCLSGTWLIVGTVLIIILAKLIFPFWPLHTLVFAMVASSSGLVLLYLSLCHQTLSGALRLAIYTWNKKLSFAAAAALVLLLAHSIAFAVVHGVVGNFYFLRRFSDFGHSATIWILIFIISFVIGYFGAILNCFVVLLFLDSIARKKDPEAVKAKILQPAGAGAF